MVEQAHRAENILRLNRSAFDAMEYGHYQWRKLRSHSDPTTRRFALKKKTSGLIAYDRIAQLGGAA